jgi:hypothetical protein
MPTSLDIRTSRRSPLFLVGDGGYLVLLVASTDPQEMRRLEPPQSGQAVRTTPTRSRTGAEAAMASAIRPVSASIPDRLRPYSPESRCIAIIVLVRTGIPPCILLSIVL